MDKKLSDELDDMSLDDKVDVVISGFDVLFERLRHASDDEMEAMVDRFVATPEFAKAIIIYLLDRADEALTP